MVPCGVGRSRRIFLGIVTVARAISLAVAPAVFVTLSCCLLGGSCPIAAAVSRTAPASKRGFDGGEAGDEGIEGGNVQGVR